ncbi:hypothetical protein [Glycomyces sp. MUSA5-2]|uniref:hypothetical protein n=1 Tax=Glycomyces sp. MUSA5-2 TaxID=2053002 RepID=UPI00300995B3
MYELNRILLRNFGPHDARYERVDLDFSAAGEPIEQVALIAGSDPGRVETRPAAAGLLLLPNGGGKGILLHALQSTITPYRHRDLESLRKFAVAMRQPTHVVLEWVNRTNGQLLVTAQVFAKTRGGEVPRQFYTFRPSHLLDIDRLPFTRNGKWTQYEAFLAFLHDQRRAHPALELEVKEGQEAWEQLQARLGLDPDLFAIQWKMNASEGAAGEAVSRSSGRQFIDWLLRKVMPTDRFTALEDGFGEYRREVSRDDSLRLQNAYAEVMERACATVAARYREHLTRRGTRDAAATHLAAFKIGMDERVAQHGRDVTTLREQHGSAVEDQREWDDKHDLGERRRNHVIMHELGLQHVRAADQAGQIAAQIAPAETETAAWSSVDLCIQLRSAANQHQDLQEALSAAEGAESVAGARRDHAAARAKAGYRRVIEAATSQKHEFEADLRTEADHLRQWRDTAATVRQSITEATVDARYIEQQLKRADHAVNEARRAQLLSDEETAAEANQRAHNAMNDAQTAKAACASTVSSADAQAREAASTANERRRFAQDATYNADLLKRELQRLREGARRIVDGPIVSELSETDRSELDAADPLRWLAEHAGGLLEQCQRSAGTIAGEQEDPRRESEEAQRLLAALGTTGALLPPRRAVASLLRALRDHDIPAESGWRWLSENCPPSEHPRYIDVYPELAEGIIVNDDAAVRRAQALLAETELLPAGAVLIAPSSAFEHHPDESGSARYVPRPTPAMHDTSAAERERAQAERRLIEATERLRLLRQRLAAVNELAHAIEAWHTSMQGQRADDLIERSAAADSHAQTANEHATAAEQAAETAAVALETARGELESAHERYNQSTAAHTQLAALAKQVAEADALRPKLERIATDNQRREQQAAELDIKITHAEERRQQRHLELADIKYRLADYQTSAEMITCTTEAEARQQLDTSPLPDLAELVADLQRAEVAFQQAAIGMELREQTELTAKELARLQTQWGSLETAIQSRAQALSADPRAKSPDQRRVAADDARQRLASLRETCKTYDAEASTLKERLEQAKPRGGRSRWLDDHEQPDTWTPASLDEAETLIAKADAQISEAAQARRAAAQTAKSLNRTLTARTEHHHQLEIIQHRLTAAARDLPTPEVGTTVPDDLTEAKQGADAAINSYDTSRKAANGATLQLNEAIKDLRSTNERHDFNDVDFPLRNQITLFPDRELPEAAERWRHNFEQFRMTVATDLDEANSRRQAVVGTLARHVENAVSMLKRANGAARVPQGDSPWAGKQFLELRFTKPAEETLAASARAIIDRFAHHPRQTAVSGIELVLACLKESVATGFTVKILKPTPTGGMDMVPIERMSKEFSGGQDLTGSILLYCVMAVLKQSDRASRRDSHGGTLFLDNPLGRANADYLMQLQFQIARAMNVQLICTTPLSEDRAIMHFPLQIHMINDSTVRQGTILIRISKQARNAIAPPLHDPDPDEPPPTGIVGAARLHRKETE